MQTAVSRAEHDRVITLARLAMLIECEGSITIGMSPPVDSRTRPQLVPAVSATNTAQDIIAEAIATLTSEGVGFTQRPKRHSNGHGRKLRHDLNVHGFDNLIRLLTRLLPYLRSKKRQAEILLEFIAVRQAAVPRSGYTSREWALVTEVRMLNGRMPNWKALNKAKDYLRRPESERAPRKSEFFAHYVAMCAELEGKLKAVA